MPLYGASLTQGFNRFFTRYARFDGRSSLSEYWMATLGLFLVSLVLTAITAAVIFGVIAAAGSDSEGPGAGGAAAIVALYGVIGLFSLATLVPSIAMTVRRFHDAGYSGWLALLMLIPGDRQPRGSGLRSSALQG